MMILLQYLVNSVLKLLPSAFNHFARWGIMDEKHENPKKPFSTFFPDLLCIPKSKW